jgi:hypothetical protein
MKLELEGSEEFLSSILVMMSFIQKSIDKKTPIKLDISVDSNEPLSIAYKESRAFTKLAEMQLYENVNLANGTFKFHM